MTDRPNILIILSDQLRRQALGCYGDPNENRLGKDDISKEIEPMRTLPSTISRLAGIIAATAVISVCGHAQAAFIGNLDGVSNESTFSVANTSLPTLGWDNLSNAARVWSQAVINNSTGMSSR